MVDDQHSNQGGQRTAFPSSTCLVNPEVLVAMDAKRYVLPSHFWRPSAAEADKYGLSALALSQFLDASIRIRLDGDSLNFYVSDIMWLSPSKPVVSWFLAYFIPAAASVADIKRKLKQLLQRRQFFAVCTACRQVKLRGDTDGTVCQGCAAEADVEPRSER